MRRSPLLELEEYVDWVDTWHDAWLEYLLHAYDLIPISERRTQAYEVDEQLFAEFMWLTK